MRWSVIASNVGKHAKERERERERERKRKKEREREIESTLNCLLIVLLIEMNNE